MVEKDAVKGEPHLGLTVVQHNHIGTRLVGVVGAVGVGFGSILISNISILAKH